MLPPLIMDTPLSSTATPYSPVVVGEGSRSQVADRKRCAENRVESSVKRPRISNSAARAPSVVDSLAVPVDFVLEQVKGKPLLSRAEAQCFLQIRVSAEELDSLTLVSAAALAQRVQCRRLMAQIAQHAHPVLLPLVSMAGALDEYSSSTALVRIQDQLETVLAELATACTTLRQFSEQNWTLAESLADVGGVSSTVAGDKRRLSDIEDEVCNRLDQLLSGDDVEGGSMADHVQRVMSRPAPVASPPPPPSAASLPSMTPMSSSQKDRASRSEEKENAPSQQGSQSSAILQELPQSPNQDESQSSRCSLPVSATQNVAEILSTLASVERTRRDE